MIADSVAQRRELVRLISDANPILDKTRRSAKARPRASIASV